jgi:hypothetical protein
MQSHQTIELLDEGLQKQLEQTPANDYIRIQDLYRKCLDNKAGEFARHAAFNLRKLLEGEEDTASYIRIGVAMGLLQTAQKFASSEAGPEKVLELGLARLVPVDSDDSETEELLRTTTSSATVGTPQTIATPINTTE